MTTLGSKEQPVRSAASRFKPAKLMRMGLFGVASYALLVVVAAVILVPILYAVLGGFKGNGQLVGDPGSLIPDPWVPDNYADVLWGADSGAFWKNVTNSLLVGVVAVGATVVIGSLAAFTFARMVFRGREAVYTLFTLGLLFPAAVAILPLYILVRDLGLNNNLLGVALPEAAFGLPLTIIILRPFFKSIPVELEDAAKIDGCGTFGFFWRILIPLARPALATVTVLATVGTWNAFMLPLIMLNNDQATLPLGVFNFSGQYTSNTALILAFTVASLVPAIIFYMIAERNIVTGLTAGSGK
ncbi:MAG TPA: carbohydrate ABC transporter permease [Candidatus Limnocylindrales bacterium]